MTTELPLVSPKEDDESDEFVSKLYWIMLASGLASCVIGTSATITIPLMQDDDHANNKAFKMVFSLLLVTVGVALCVLPMAYERFGIFGSNKTSGKDVNKNDDVVAIENKM
jgi:Na+-driven multidrug efflux pump